MTMELQFKQIQCVPVPNTSATQCNVMMYGLTADGKVWRKTEAEDVWWPESTVKGDAESAVEVLRAVRDWDIEQLVVLPEQLRKRIQAFVED
jgi:hypothetical protein